MNQPKKYISLGHRMNTTSKPWYHINKIWFAIWTSIEVVHVLTFLPPLVTQVFRSLNKTDVSFDYIYECTLTLKHANWSRVIFCFFKMILEENKNWRSFWDWYILSQMSLPVSTKAEVFFWKKRLSKASPGRESPASSNCNATSMQCFPCHSVLNAWLKLVNTVRTEPYKCAHIFVRHEVRK